MRRLGFAVIGAGRIGKIHARNLRFSIPESDLLALCDPVPGLAAECARDLNIPTACTNPADLWQNPLIEAVAICSSTDTHARLIEEAAAAGKQIFCEKPIAQDLGVIDCALKAVSVAKVKLQVGFNRRFDPSFRRVRDLVAQGQVGTPHLLRITSRDPAPPSIEYVKVSGGIFMDMAIHDFDMARFLLNEDVVDVFATGSVLVDPRIGDAGDYDTAVSVLRFKSGAIGMIDNSRKACYGYDQRVEVFGSLGMASAENRTPHSVVLSDGGGLHGSLPLHFFAERYGEAYVAEMQSFVSSVLEDRDPEVSGVDGRAPILLAEAAKRSVAEGRSVRLTEVDI